VSRRLGCCGDVVGPARPGSKVAGEPAHGVAVDGGVALCGIGFGEVFPCGLVGLAEVDQSGDGAVVLSGRLKQGDGLNGEQ
jgi:hypothetical protein